jgi:hypothetical protein
VVEAERDARLDGTVVRRGAPDGNLAGKLDRPVGHLHDTYAGRFGKVFVVSEAVPDVRREKGQDALDHGAGAGRPHDG